MLRTPGHRNVETTLLALVAGLALGAAPEGGSAADAPADVQKQLLELTGGRRVKVTWNQGAQSGLKLWLFDTKDGELREVPFAGSAPLLTADGRWVFASAGKAPGERRVKAYNTDSRKVVEFPVGPTNNLLAVWQEPKGGRTWVYVNDSGDRNENWDVPAGKIWRFPADKPAARELFWDRTRSHIYLMFSADGTRACFEPNWSNIGQLSIAYDAKGQVDQDKSDYKQCGGGCFPGLAPDNSYRLFRLDGDHHAITMHDADGANPRKIAVSDMPGVREKGRNVWLTSWSKDPRYLTLVAPAGNDAAIWMGRFDEGCTKVEAWVRVTAPGPQCWQSQAWVEPGKGRKLSAVR